MANLFERIAATSARGWFQAAQGGGATRYTQQLRAIETVESIPANSIVNPIDYKVGPFPNWTRTPALFFFAKQATPPGREGGIREIIRHVDLIIGVAFTGTTDAEADEITTYRYVAAIRQTVALDFTLGTTGATQFVAGCVEEEADLILDMTDHATTRKSRYVRFLAIVQDRS